jgi:ankyrin repeat protein
MMSPFFLLTKRNTHKMDLIEAVKKEDYKRVKLLLEQGADVNYRDWFEMTALFWAIERDCIYICKLLIKNGADVNHKNKNQWTPLMYAVFDSKIEIIKLLLVNGANVNDINLACMTALDYAQVRSNFYAGQILCWRGAKHSKNKTINLFLLFIYCRVIPRDILREIHTKWIS